MRKRIVSIILSMAIAFSGAANVKAAESTVDQQEEILVTEAEQEAARTQRSGQNTLLADQIGGLFVTFGDQTVSQVTDQKYNHTLTIPDGIVVNSNVTVQMLMQNVASMGITSQVGNSYLMNFNLGSDYKLDDYLGEVKNFGQATVSGKIGGVAYHYQVKGSKSGNATVIQATTSDAAAAVAELEKHTQICTGEAQVAANGFKIERGGYIEVGADRLEFNPDYQGELIVGDGDITFGEYETDIRDYFLYKKGEASREDQIRLYLPKDSYLSLGGKSVRLTEDVLVEINGLADGYDILDASDATVLQKMFEAKSGSELLVAMLQTANQITKSAEGREVTVDIRFPNLIEASQIKLDASEVNLNVGDSQQLNVTVLPEDAYDKTVTWTSSDPEVATVQDGKITGVKPGTAVITATTANGLKAECKVTVGLSKPKGLRVFNGSANATKLKLSWKAVPGAVKYEVYRSKKENGTYKRVATVKKTNYLDKKLITGTRYYYKITAVAGDVTSEFSAIKGRRPRLKAPNLTVKAGKGTARLKWRNLSYADGYHVFMKTKKNGKFQRIAKVQTPPYRKNKLKSGKTYYFRVRGYRVMKGKKCYGFYSDTVKVKIK